MTDTFEWRGRVGDVWAEEWRRTDRTLAPVNDALVEEVAAQAAGFERPRILDIGCGAGATSLALAERIAGAEIIGIDLSAPLVAVARERAGISANLRFEVADASRWTSPAGHFDPIVSRHGVMFFDDPVAAFSHIRSLAGVEARLVFSCFRHRRENQWAEVLRPILERFAPDGLPAPTAAPGPFAFGDPARIEGILGAAGFTEPQIRAFDFDFVAGAGDDPIADAVSYFRRIGPFAAMLRDLDESDGEEALAHLASVARDHLDRSQVAFAAAAWIVMARAATEQLQ